MAEQIKKTAGEEIDFSLIESLSDPSSLLGQYVFSFKNIEMHAYSSLSFVLTSQSIAGGGSPDFVEFTEGAAIRGFHSSKAWRSLIDRWEKEANLLQDPDKSNALVGLAGRLIAVHDIERAKDILLQVQAPSRTYVSSWARRWGKVGCYQKAISIDQRMKRFVARGLMEDGRPEEAKAILSEYTNDLPAKLSVAGLTELSILLYTVGENNKALFFAKKAYEKSGPYSIQEVLSAYRKMQRFDLAQEVLSLYADPAKYPCTITADEKASRHAPELYKSGLHEEAYKKISEICGAGQRGLAWLEVYKFAYENDLLLPLSDPVAIGLKVKPESIPYTSMAVFHYLRGEKKMADGFLERAVLNAGKDRFTCSLLSIAHFARRGDLVKVLMQKAVQSGNKKHKAQPRYYVGPWRSLRSKRNPDKEYGRYRGFLAKAACFNLVRIDGGSVE